MTAPKPERLRKRLSLLDVYLVSTGAMFSSGFFLLPGIAAATTGPSVVLAYLISGLLIIPAMLSQAELATAMPRAGGAYYYLDRTLGPLVGTMGGIGAWLALMLKSAFALIGIGTYLALFFDIPFTPIAITFAVIFGILNIFGAKESTGLLRWLVFGLLTILAFFVVDGLANMSSTGFAEVQRTRFTPFLEHGVDGLLEAVGLVFVSYVGLTQVATLAEEVKDPERNIPLGMTISLTTVAAIYVVGVGIMVAILGIDELGRPSLTPVAHAAREMFHWLPPRVGEFLLVGAAVAAFASMSNTGILAASRYPLAMARDHLMPQQLAKLGRFRTPVPAIVLTCSVLILFLLLLDVRGVAELASALQLTLFGLLNIAVIVMRESHIESYDPGFRSPFYPWIQLVGIIAPLILVAEMGWLPSLFTMGVFAASIGWYNYYARGHLARDGAIYHVFERLGRRRFAGLDRELRDIMKEKGARAADPFDEIVARAFVIDLQTSRTVDDIVRQAAGLLESRVPATATQLADSFSDEVSSGVAPVSHGAALLHLRLPDMVSSELVLVRCGAELVDENASELMRQAAGVPLHAIFFLVSGESDAGQHLRILAQLAGRIEDDDFMDEWVQDRDEQDLKETLLRDDRFLSLRLRTGTQSEPLIGKTLMETQLPEGSLIALIRRYGETLVPRGRTVLREGDRLTIIGAPAGLREVELRYGGAHDTREYHTHREDQT
jgi:amino acid transporter/mannitol/fructose-specific phosphotransferase system IIA component (Ntr-type)